MGTIGNGGTVRSVMHTTQRPQGRVLHSRRRARCYETIISVETKPTLPLLDVIDELDIVLRFRGLLRQQGSFVLRTTGHRRLDERIHAPGRRAETFLQQTRNASVPSRIPR